MSLLNDALRKKRGERFPSREPSGPERKKPGMMSNRKRQWFAVSGGIALLAAASAVWLYVNASLPASDSARAAEPSYPAMTHTDHEKSSQTTAGSFTPSRDVSTSTAAPVMAMAAAPVGQAVHAAENQGVAVKPDASSRPLSSDSDRGTSRGENIGRRKHPDADLIPEARSSRERPDPGAGQPAVHSAREASLTNRDRLFQRACLLHRRGGLDQAIALYQSVLKQDPTHAQARFNLVAAYLQGGAYAQAYPLVAKLFAEDPANPQVMLNLAIAHIGCGRDRQALALLDKAGKLPNAPLYEIAFHKAVAFGHLGRPKAAQASYRRAEAIRPDDPGLLFNMALAFDRQQQYGAAVDYYLKYLEHVRGSDGVRIKKIRQRIRTLETYGAEEKLKEKFRG